ncbi:HEPN domain-containing protein [Microcella sp.]|uniref:HEPN domain-containing protein n=1 Tax=Microcella sp. TaxID=1913979 RepID=UPI00255D1907|nr:HEPN domain-containing protein [Microcella sp.]MBX9470484.1 HEPN domain-containing protein [Microcella sp.]
MTWQQGTAVIDQLLNRGELERVTPNPEFALASLDLCDTHIATAQSSLSSDPVAAVAVAYDAARKALVALLLAQGLRPTHRGGHIAVTDAASAQLDPPNRIGRQVDRIRRLRNDNEYPDAGAPQASMENAADAIAVARDAVQAAQLVLPHLSPF